MSDGVHVWFVVLIYFKHNGMSPTNIIMEKCSWYSDSLWAGWSRDRIPVEARFSALAQTGLASLLQMGIRSFLGGKAAGAWH